MEGNKPHKIIIIGDGQPVLPGDTLSLLQNNFGDEFTVITVSEARKRGVPTPLTINDGELYVAPEQTFKITRPPQITEVRFEEYSDYKRKKSYEPEYAKFDKIRKKHKK